MTTGTRKFAPRKVFPRGEIEQSIPERFAAMVRRHPDRLAVRDADRELTYSEIDLAANRVAQALLESVGEQAGQVALLLDKNAEMIATILGVLKAGMTYVPLDPTYPLARLRYIVEDSRSARIVTAGPHQALADELGEGIAGADTLDIERLLYSASDEDPNLSIPLDSPTWIIYTSGSTGQPKGVVQTHRNVLHYVMNYANYFALEPSDRLSLLQSCSVNGGAHDVFAALLNGAALLPYEIRERGLAPLADWIVEEAITVVCIVPTLFRHFVKTLDDETVLPRVRLLRLIGEPVYSRDVEAYRRHFSDDCVFVNRLGSTETGSLLFNMLDKTTAIEGTNVPVGYPVEGNEILLLDDAGEDVGVGPVGEIAVRSRYLSPGYFGKPELTSAAFVPSQTKDAERIYRMGDLGYRLPDGCVVCLGRKDFQVKVRGHRIELAEVESALLALPAIEEAAVMAREDAGGEQRLVAYVVSSDGSPPAVQELRERLHRELPDHMVPSYFVFMDALPLLPNGKVARRELPAPEQTRPELETELVAPRAPLEQVLTELWETLLGIEPVGVYDDFLDLGGDSLLAVSLSAAIEKELGSAVPLAVLAQASTVAELARAIQEERSSHPQALVPLQPAGSKPPFFCVHGAGGHVFELLVLARHLGEEQPFYGLESPGRDGEQEPLRTVEELAARYIEEIRELQPEGPYRVGGFSMGGVVAFEMARQLRAAGSEVGLLVLFDTHCPVSESVTRRLRRLGSLATHLARRAPVHFRKLVELGRSGSADYVRQRARVAREAIVPDSPIKRANVRAIRRYQPRSYHGHLTFVWAEQSRAAYSPDTRLRWWDFVDGGVEVLEVRGNHTSMMMEPHVGVLARKLKAVLDRDA